MSVTQQAKAARRKAKTDPRYQGFRKDAVKRASKYQLAVQRERDRIARKKK
jgi:hypothetical protein